MVVSTDQKSTKSLRARLISGGLWAVAGKSLSAFGSFAVFLIVANSISNEGTSAFVFCESAAIVGALLATGGLHSVIIRVLRNWRQTFPRQLILSFGGRIVAIYVGLFGLVGSAAFAACVLLQSTAVEQLSRYLLVVLIWAFLLGANQIVSEFLRGFENFRDAATLGGQNPGILTLGVLLPILLVCSATKTLTIWTVLGSQVFAMAITLVYGLIQLRKTFRHHNQANDPEFFVSEKGLGVGGILSEGIPNLIAQISTLGVTQSEILILGQLSSAREIAAYAGIKKLVQLTGAPLLMINSALPTVIADLVLQKRLAQLEIVLRGSATLCFLPLLVISAVFIAFPMWTIDLFFDETFSIGGSCLQLLSVANLAAVGSGSCGLLLMMSGNQRSSMLSGMIGAIVFIILAPGLTAVSGITGMALGVMVSTITRSIVSAIFARKCVGIWTTPTLSHKLLLESFQAMRKSRK